MDPVNIRLILCLPLLMMILQQVAQHSVAAGSNNIIPVPMKKEEPDNLLRFHDMGMDFQEQEPHVHHHHHDTRVNVDDDDIDPSLMVFFFFDDLKIGKTMLVHFPDRFLPSFDDDFLSKEEADKIPFSLKQLPTLLHYFSIPQDSPQATAMEDTLRVCDNKPIAGETKLCATSVASMLDFAKHVFGNNNYDNKIQVLSTIYKTKLTAELQKYTVTEVPKEISASNSKMVACHTLPYPYQVLYCHHQEESKVFRVQLVNHEHGDEVEAIAVCHMDTSQWGRSHIAFRVLGIEPGTQPVCHFFPADHFVLLPPKQPL